MEKMVIKCFDVKAGLMIALLRVSDAKKLGVFPTDRIKLRNPKNGKSISAVIDTTDTMVEEGEIGVFQDVSDYLGVKHKHGVEVTAISRPKSVAYIKRKISNEKLSASEIKKIVEDIAANHLSDIEVASFMTAVYIHDFDLEETVAMTRALVENGKTINIDKNPNVDKHSIGGTNGRVTMVLTPIVAAAGCYIAKTSSRSITSSAGTADAMDVLCPVSLSLKQMKNICEKTGAVIAWGGAVDLAPADDKIIRIEHPLALDPPGQVIASVLAKKASVGARYVVIDLPVGPRVKINSKEHAEKMARKFIDVGKKLGMKCEVVLTDGTEPCGRAFGPALEARYVLETLEGKRFDDLGLKSCELAGVLLELAGKARKGAGFEKAKKILESGKALEKMKEIIKAQGGNTTKSEEVHLAKFKKVVDSERNGEISNVDVRELNTIARLAGAPADKKAGVMLLAEKGDRVKKGQPLFEIFAENKRKLQHGFNYAQEHEVITMEKMILGTFK